MTNLREFLFHHRHYNEKLQGFGAERFIETARADPPFS